MGYATATSTGDSGIIAVGVTKRFHVALLRGLRGILHPTTTQVLETLSDTRAKQAAAQRAGVTGFGARTASSTRHVVAVITCDDLP